MNTIKPIQATPELSGKDARELIIQVNTEPTKEAMERNELLYDVLRTIRVDKFPE